MKACSAALAYIGLLIVNCALVHDQPSEVIGHQGQGRKDERPVQQQCFLGHLPQDDADQRQDQEHEHNDRFVMTRSLVRRGRRCVVVQNPTAMIIMASMTMTAGTMRARRFLSFPRTFLAMF